MKISKIKHLLILKNKSIVKNKLKKLNTYKLYPIEVNFFNLFLKKYKFKTIIGLCNKRKKNYSISLINKIRKDKIRFNFFLNSPFILDLKYLNN